MDTNPPDNRDKYNLLPNKAQLDALTDEDDYLPGNRLRCTANSATTGSRCKNPAVLGTHVCNRHGGLESVQSNKAQRKLQQLLDASWSRIENIIENGSDREVVRVWENLLDRTGNPRQVTMSVPEARDAVVQAMLQYRMNVLDNQDNQNDYNIIEGQIVEEGGNQNGAETET